MVNYDKFVVNYDSFVVKHDSFVVKHDSFMVSSPVFMVNEDVLTIFLVSSTPLRLRSGSNSLTRKNFGH
jgi:hypothetical protein